MKRNHGELEIYCSEDPQTTFDTYEEDEKRTIVIQTCAQCGGHQDEVFVCPNCACTCCVKCTRKCIACQTTCCDDCSAATCHICGAVTCRQCNAFDTCAYCGNKTCKDCESRRICYKCDMKFIDTCKHRYCTDCDGVFCLNCADDFIRCGYCLNRLCTVCENAAKRCGLCGVELCNHCPKLCPKCHAERERSLIIQRSEMNTKEGIISRLRENIFCDMVLII